MNVLVSLQQQLPKIILAVCCALTAHQAALLTWAVYPAEESKYTWTPPAKKSGAKKASLDNSNIQQAKLFGDYQGDALVASDGPISAPKTRLKLTLVGVVAATDPKFSSVIIEHKGEQDSYFINSEIPGTNAKVTQIFNDRIILLVSGEQQTLILEGLGKSSGSSTEKASRSKRGKKKSKNIDLDREDLLSNPGKLTDYIKISPVREGEEIKGYRVKPGKDSSLFEEAGLESGDLAVELNGIDLTDTTQAMGLMKEFPTMTDISLTVDREGELHELFFRIP